MRGGLQVATAGSEGPRVGLGGAVPAPGGALDEVDDLVFLRGCADLGRALADLHAGAGSTVRVPHRGWAHDEEAERLRALAPSSCRVAVEAALALPLSDTPVVPSWGGLVPGQVCVDGTGRVDVAAQVVLAPPGLDLGSVIAHLRREELLGRRRPAVGGAAVSMLRAAYGPAPSDTAAFACLAVVRLAVQADVRHGRPAERDALLDLAAELAGAA